MSMRTVEALYEDGLLRPETPLPLRQGERVAVIVLRQPDPNRWDLKRLGRVSQAEELLAEWGSAPQTEDCS